MNIIIEPENLESFTEKYTVLELDTIRILPENRLVTAYCVVEQMPIPELEKIEEQRQLHTLLLEKYKTRNWTEAVQLIDQLNGRWGGELDSFYEDLQRRIDKYSQQDPGEQWDGIIEKNASAE
jgi:hypothetical protein